MTFDQNANVRSSTRFSVLRQPRAAIGVASAFAAGFLASAPWTTTEAQTAPSATSQSVWTPPNIAALPDDERGRQVRSGRDLFTATFAHIGPNVADPAKRFAGNDLACSSCHLDAGVKRFGLPVYGLRDDFPAYSARRGAETTLPDRLNACMARSMNGRPLPTDSPEMKALVAYIDFLSSGLAPGEKLSGYGSGAMPELPRAADPERGKAVYAKACLACHGVDGAGLRRGAPSTDLGYLFPPLWGPDSFNDGAGMNRLITAANFVHFNMPHGADYLNPQLSAEEAWDVAAYFLSQPRPQKRDLDKDFPDRLEKPIDAPYGPYADGFSQQQHKYGPFAPIRAAIDALKAEQAKAGKRP